MPVSVRLSGTANFTFGDMHVPIEFDALLSGSLGIHAVITAQDVRIVSRNPPGLPKTLAATIGSVEISCKLQLPVDTISIKSVNAHPIDPTIGGLLRHLLDQLVGQAVSALLGSTQAKLQVAATINSEFDSLIGPISNLARTDLEEALDRCKALQG